MLTAFRIMISHPQREMGHLLRSLGHKISKYYHIWLHNYFQNDI